MRNRKCRLLCLCLALGFSSPTWPLSIQLDYTYDNLGFFSGANAFRRDIMRAAADVFENRITDELAAISNFDNGISSFQFTSTIERPDTREVVTGPSNIPFDTVIVYVGGSNLLDTTTLGQGGPEAFGWDASIAAGDEALFDDWLDLITSRGQGDGTNHSVYNAVTEDNPPTVTETAFDTALWGGSISFNNTANWYFDIDPSTEEAFTGTDFYSVALHELAHVFGIGTADSWFNLVNFGNSTFEGGNSIASFGIAPPLADEGHFLFGLSSTVNGDSQEVLMDPDLAEGQRKRLTDLDWAALEDLGWQVQDPQPNEPDAFLVPATSTIHAFLMAVAVCWVGIKRWEKRKTS